MPALGIKQHALPLSSACDHHLGNPLHVTVGRYHRRDGWSVGGGNDSLFELNLQILKPELGTSTHHP